MNTDNFAGGRAAAPWVAVAGAVLVLLGGVAFSRPASHTADEPVPVRHRASFTYSAAAAPPLYPNGFTTGDPVFTRLADRVTVGFTYHVDSAATVALDGTVRVDAILSGAAGWTRVVPLLGPGPIAPGDTVEVELHLSALRALGVEADAITGTPAGGLAVAVAPLIDFHGAVADEDVAGRFAPTLDFTLDPSALRLVAPAGEGASAIERTQDEAVPVSTARGNDLVLPLVDRGVAVNTARVAGPAGGIALLFAAAALASAGRRRGEREPGRIAARYGHLLIPVHSDRRDEHSMVDVSTMDDLVRLAEHHGELVTHRFDAADIGSHTYVVRGQGTSYRYRCGERADPIGP